MKAPEFWQQPPGCLARLLQPVGGLYGAVTLARMRHVGFTPERPAIVVGGFDVGGAGKTPVCQAIARILLERGYSIAFVSRGFGRRGSTAAQRVTPDQTVAETGDEALLLARAGPAYTGSNRIVTTQLALSDARPDMLILDDGLQSRRVSARVALAVADGMHGIGNGLCLPAGPLRAPLEGQLRHVSGVVIIGHGRAGDHVAATAKARGIAVFRAAFAQAQGAPDLRARRTIAFAGIGLPQKFFAFLRTCGADIIATRVFPDHHRYKTGEIAPLQKLAHAQDALLVTTEKDFVNLPAGLADPPQIMPVQVRFDEELAFSQWLCAELAV